jgi:hypothetical protein
VQVPGKTHEECYGKHFEGVDQPIQASMKRKAPSAPSTKAAEAGGISAAAALADGRAKPATTLHQAKLARREQQWKQRQNELTENPVSSPHHRRLRIACPRLQTSSVPSIHRVERYKWVGFQGANERSA